MLFDDTGVSVAWCPACHGAQRIEIAMDGDGTMLLDDAIDTLIIAGLRPRWIGLDRMTTDAGRIETWRVYGRLLWAAEDTLARMVAVVLAKRDAIIARDAQVAR
ncbi:MAG: hypothetical protein U0556_10080 [Dehalococcoidia bacterium]